MRDRSVLCLPTGEDVGELLSAFKLLPLMESETLQLCFDIWGCEDQQLNGDEFEQATMDYFADMNVSISDFSMCDVYTVSDVFDGIVIPKLQRAGIDKENIVVIESSIDCVGNLTILASHRPGDIDDYQ